MDKVHQKYLEDAISVCLRQKEGTEPRRKIECTGARMMQKSLDVQFGIRFSTWNVESIFGKWEKIFETLKMRYVIFSICRKRGEKYK